MKGQRALKGYQHLRDPPQRALKSQRVSFSTQNPSNCAVSAASWEEGSAAPVRQPPAHDPVQPAYLSPAFASAICNRQPFQSRIFFRNILVIRFLAVDAPAQWTRVIGSGRACGAARSLLFLVQRRGVAWGRSARKQSQGATICNRQLAASEIGALWNRIPITPPPRYASAGDVAFGSYAHRPKPRYLGFKGSKGHWRTSLGSKGSKGQRVF